ncbi:hypothetical protein JMM81_10660 [Bacillus sp. V3B]|uniref:hypothetical protein n=1 Tax=Bacillus sp. V3B TaxID=2804915 RepID=UPI00210D028A|nr:hypothetical protein [Bacillus sp. V3B]MCQ6275420.1 hypothetical protein [Bacillus sp. V3B]
MYNYQDLYYNPYTMENQRRELRQAKGKVTLLRVHDVGTGYGPSQDFIDVEVVFWLDTHPRMAFGFQLRNDKNRPAREGMLSLLREAFENNWTVTTDYSIDPGKKNGVAIRVWATK